MSKQFFIMRPDLCSMFSIGGQFFDVHSGFSNELNCEVVCVFEISMFDCTNSRIPLGIETVEPVIADEGDDYFHSEFLAAERAARRVWKGILSRDGVTGFSLLKFARFVGTAMN